jgi:hypothetical protein
LREAVKRVRPIVALVLLLCSGPYQLSWAVAFAALAHDSHHVSLRASHGRLDVLLHHHPVALDDRGVVVGMDGPSHDDHVLRGTDDAVAPGRRIPHATSSSYGVPSGMAPVATSVARRVRMAPRAGIGPAPPPGTIVLRI